jgi:hypothetical protein
MTILERVNLFLSDLSLYLKVETIELYGLSVSKLLVGALFSVILLALLAVRGRNYFWVKFAAVLILVPGFALAMLIALSDQLSHAKPLPLSWLQAQGEKGIMLVSEPVPRPPKKIELMIELNAESRLFWLPWSEKLEKSLKGARAQRDKHKGRGNMYLKFQPSIEMEEPPEFYFLPWPAPPSKDGDDRPPSYGPPQPGERSG